MNPFPFMTAACALGEPSSTGYYNSLTTYLDNNGTATT